PILYDQEAWPRHRPRPHHRRRHHQKPRRHAGHRQHARQGNLGPHRLAFRPVALITGDESPNDQTLTCEGTRSATSSGSGLSLSFRNRSSVHGRRLATANSWTPSSIEARLASLGATCPSASAVYNRFANWSHRGATTRRR